MPSPGARSVLAGQGIEALVALAASGEDDLKGDGGTSGGLARPDSPEKPRGRNLLQSTPTPEQGGGFFNYLRGFLFLLEDWFSADFVLLPGLLSLGGLRADVLGNTPNLEVMFGQMNLLGIFSLFFNLNEREFGLGPQVLGISSQVGVTINDSTPTWSLVALTLFRDGLGILEALGLESDPDYVNPGFPWILLPRAWQGYFMGTSLFQFNIYDGSIVEALGEVAAMVGQLWTITVATSI